MMKAINIAYERIKSGAYVEREIAEKLLAVLISREEFEKCDVVIDYIARVDSLKSNIDDYFVKIVKDAFDAGNARIFGIIERTGFEFDRVDRIVGILEDAGAINIDGEFLVESAEDAIERAEATYEKLSKIKIVLD